MADTARAGAVTLAAAPPEREERKAEARPAPGRPGESDAESPTEDRPGVAAPASGLAARLARKLAAGVAAPPLPG
eukprot:scaffold5246_cov105-Isochrysis_galbana.AAC.7